MNKNSGLSFFVLLLLLTASGHLVIPAWGQETAPMAAPLAAPSVEIDFDSSLSVDWTRRELNFELSYNLAQAGIKLPTGRVLGEGILSQAYSGILRPHLLSMRVDSNSTIADLVNRGELSLSGLDAICKEAEKTSPYLSPDLARMIGRYRIPIESLYSRLAPRRRTVEPERPLIPVPAADYTGIIIIADEELPIHGRRTQALVNPCLFPKIWDTGMNLIYERNMTESAPMVIYTTRETIFRPTPSGLEGELAALAGPNPLRIIAREVFGIDPTDPVIDRDDALLILSTENNRRLLREGRVVLVLNEGKLKL
jgi:hypothetical protein